MKSLTVIVLIALIISIGVGHYKINAQIEEAETPVVVQIDKTQFTKAEIVKAIKVRRYPVYDYLIEEMTPEQWIDFLAVLFPQVVNNTEENQAKILDDGLRQFVKNECCTKAQALAFKAEVQKE